MGSRAVRSAAFLLSASAAASTTAADFDFRFRLQFVGAVGETRQFETPR
jgi:hypothetical protein